MLKMKRKPIILKLGSLKLPIYCSTTSTGHDQFTLAWHEDGKFKRQAFGSEKDARERGGQILEILKAGLSSASDFRVQDIDAYRTCLAIIEKTGMSLESFCKESMTAITVLGGRGSLIEAARHFIKMHPADLKPMLVEDVAREMILAKQKLGKDVEYVRQLKYQCRKLWSLCVKNIADISGEDLNLFVEMLGDLAPRTRNNCINGVRELFSFAKKNKYLPKDWDEMEGIELFEDDGGEILIYTPEEMDRLLSFADEEIIPALAISAFAGLRQSEVMKLDWDEVKVAEKVITITKKKSKTGTRRQAPVPDNLAAWLAPYVSLKGPVLPMLAGEYKRARVRAAALAGFEWRKNALRHSFISYRVAKEKNVPQVALEAGNSPQMIFTSYLQLVTPSAAETWFAISPVVKENVVSINS